MRKICYVTGTRADFGLMQNTLQCIHAHKDLHLSIIATGMHLLPEYGETWSEIVDCGLQIDAKVVVELSGNTGAEMALALGQQIIGFTEALQKIKPDIVLLLGDRGEMLAGAITALHLGIHIVHIHGGELSGTVDESIRHSISKLAHYHFATTEKSRNRLIRMGERAESVFVTGAPGLDAIYKVELLDKPYLFSKYGLKLDMPLLLILFHPVVQQSNAAAEQTKSLLEAAIESGMQSLVIMPNSDAGGQKISQVIHSYSEHELINVAVHVQKVEFLSLITHADVMLGNSSSGIIEAASLDTPVVNVGDRQNCRERNSNVIDVVANNQEIASGIQRARNMKGQHWDNIYGDGSASERIIDGLLSVSLVSEVLEKINAY